MFALAIVVTVLLLLEALPSAIAALVRAQAGVTRLDQLTRLGLLEGRRLWVVSLLGVLHLAACALVIVGLFAPVAGVAGGAVEAVVFAWVLSRQLGHGDRGRALFAYLLFTVLAVAVLVVDLLRVLPARRGTCQAKSQLATAAVAACVAGGGRRMNMPLLSP